MDEEFDTILEDNSVNEICMCLVQQLHRCTNGRFDEVRAEFAHLPPVARWLEPGAKIVNYLADSDSDSDEDDDDDEDMEQNEAGHVNNVQLQNGERNVNNSGAEMDEDGWMRVTARRRQR